MNKRKKRHYRLLTWKDAELQICSTHYGVIKEAVVRERRVVERYIQLHPEFLSSLEPIPPDPAAPEIVKRMQQASVLTGVGPMAAVAGAVAQIVGEEALKSGAEEAIVDNGGDIYLVSPRSVVIGLNAGENSVSGRIGLEIHPDSLPLGICSSSSRMGHSLSFGDCDLVTVISANTALADAAATAACNEVTGESSISHVLDEIMAIQGVQGILVMRNEKVGMAGHIPKLIRLENHEEARKLV